MSALLDQAARLDADRDAHLNANDEAEHIAYALARNVRKGEVLAARNDEHAMDLQVQMQGCIGWLPA